ncbi:MAG: hypothetical protein NVV73_14155 [Cellvibrionaceae bacterium]|nr:hypothetical protein [Cellvibrionaceae bacterium]
MTTAKKAAFYLLLPILGTIKIERIIGRHLLYQGWKNKVRVMLLDPVLVLGICYWIAGFYNALWTEKGISRER